MEIKILDSSGVAEVLGRLIVCHKEIWIAVAWGYNGTLADLLMNNNHKFVSVTFGINRFATAPDLVQRLIGVPNAFIAKTKIGIFHPKLYYFRSDRTADAIVGSSNFTSGGLHKNLEVCLHISGKADQPIFLDIQEQFSKYKNLQQPVTDQIAESYRQQFEVEVATHASHDPVLPDNKRQWKRVISPLTKMTWQQFAKKARLDPYHGFEKRLCLLHEIQILFARAGSFNDLSLSHWKAIAGVIGKNAKKDAGLNDFEWEWFGTCRAFGSFAHLICERDQNLARALDIVPRQGNIVRKHYDAFCVQFSKAFSSSDRTGGIATASRLLAMKRPDAFVCVNRKNRLGLSSALSFSPTTLDLANYWEQVIEPIRLSAWYNVARPTQRDGELWDYRAAMLDTIYYEQN